MSGLIGTAPCGHRGEHVTANFVVCLEGCDSAKPTDPGNGSASDGVVLVDLDGQVTKATCMFCGSDDVESNLPAMWPGGPTTHCYSCGCKS